MVECEALRIIWHWNLVKIVIACSSVSFHGNDFKALVYEYMPNGSLKTWLHQFSLVGNVHEQRSLNLIQGLNIAIDAGSVGTIVFRPTTQWVQGSLGPCCEVG